MSRVVELRGFEPLTSCMPSQLHRQTGPYGASPDTTSPEVGRTIRSLVVLLSIGSKGPVADTLLTTDQMHNVSYECLQVEHRAREAERAPTAMKLSPVCGESKGLVDVGSARLATARIRL